MFQEQHGTLCPSGRNVGVDQENAGAEGKAGDGFPSQNVFHKCLVSRAALNKISRLEADQCELIVKFQILMPPCGFQKRVPCDGRAAVAAFDPLPADVTFDVPVIGGSH